MVAEIYRKVDSGISTIGDLRINGVFECYTLEQEWNNNVKGNSCIPAGEYKFGTKTYGKYYKKYGHPILKIFDVPNRGEILCHIGNWPKDTLGCVLFGKTKGIDYVGRSKEAYDAAYPKLIKCDEIIIYSIYN